MKNFFAKVKAFFVKKDGGDRSLLTKQAIAIIACLVVIAIIDRKSTRLNSSHTS